MAHTADNTDTMMMMMMMKMAVNEDASDKDDDHEDNDEFNTTMSMKERLKYGINIQNMHVIKMILLCLAPGAEEDKKHNHVTSSYLCLSERKTQYTI